ncbi:alpha/beta hydrolase [Microbacterium sp. NPDC089189]|uniref:alpha/beta fold hydrolase n=1 Tax=Microbacterium sp. NPDC089189 TaxID=3154972 RepID=UPI00343BBF2A
MSAAHRMGESRYLSLDDGRRLHHRRAGTGAATVVFESGMGFSSAAWGRVQPAVAAHAATLVYDRAGIGRSEVDTAPRTLARAAADLSQLLSSVAGPLVLVGHSWGGPIVRTVAAGGRFDVRGVILVDQSDENVDAYFAPAVERRMSQTGPLFALAMRLSVTRLRAQATRGQSPEVAAELRRDLAVVAQTMGAELGDFLPALRDLRAHPERMDPLRDLDVTVITGLRAGLTDRRQRSDLAHGHRLTAERLGARRVAAPRSGHNVMFDEPDLLVREIVRSLPR